MRHLSTFGLFVFTLAVGMSVGTSESSASEISPSTHESKVIRIASKNFGESYLLSEISAQLLEARGFEVSRQFGLGGTLICYGALANDQIDLYVEYTGTITQAILKSPEPLELVAIRRSLPEDLELLALPALPLRKCC